MSQTANNDPGLNRKQLGQHPAVRRPATHRPVAHRLVAHRLVAHRPAMLLAFGLLLALAAAVGRAARPAAADAFPGVNGKIAYSVNGNQIAVMNSDGSGQTVINTAPQYWQDQPVWSPDGTKIAFLRFTLPYAQIHVMNADGSAAASISGTGNSDGGPSWSPDGSKILFDSLRTGSDGIDVYLMDADGTDVVQLTGVGNPSGARDDYDMDPAFSPDGTKIAFASDRGDPDDDEGDTFDIWVMNANGSSPVRLTTGYHLDSKPMWTPDGSKIVFERLWSDADGNDFDIMIMDANGANLTNLTSASAGSDTTPAVSPDGTKIAFVRGEDTAAEIYTMDLSGANQVRRTNNTVGNFYPHWGARATGIIIEKQTVPDGSAQAFSFDPSWTAATPVLGDGQQYAAVPLAPGAYSITEAATPGWTLQTAVCSGDDDGTSPAAINLEAGELVTCVFTNSEDAPTTADVTVVKQLIGHDALLPWAFDFTGDLGAFQLNDTNQSDTFNNVAAGEITITEDAISGYTTRVICESGGDTLAEEMGPSVTFTLTAGEDATCTFTNALRANLTIVKTVSGGPADWSFSFSGDLGLLTLTDDDPDALFIDLLPGDYTISETVPDGWQLTDIDCGGATAVESGSGVTVSLFPGDEVTCTFSNGLAPAPLAIYATAAGGSVPGAGAYTKGDVLKWDGATWTKWFSSAAEGLNVLADLTAFDVDDGDAGSGWLVWRQTLLIAGAGRTLGQDIVYYDGGTFATFFDGSDVGLTTSGERIDGLEVRPGSPGCDHDLLISTVAGGSVRNGTNPPIAFTGEDVLRFCLTSVGANTAGSWQLLEELQSEGLGRNNSLDIAAGTDGSPTRLYFLPKTAFTLDGATVRPSEIAAFDRGSRLFSGPLWKAKDHGLMQTVDGIDVVGPLP